MSGTKRNMEGSERCWRLMVVGCGLEVFFVIPLLEGDLGGGFI